jgi:hypothetical protein
MSFADVKPRTQQQRVAARRPAPPPSMTPSTAQLSANEVALLEEEEEAQRRRVVPDGLVELREQAHERAAMRAQAHDRFLRQYTEDATQLAQVFAELGQHLEQQQESLDKVEDNTQKAVDELREGITEYAAGAKEKAKLGARQKTLVAGALGGATAVAAIATGGLALGVAAGAAAVVGGLGAQAEYKLVADAAQGEVEAMEIQQALGPLKDRKEWSPDADARECQGCSVAFSMFWRRHHCRSCGGVFCANCAPKRVVRLCNACNGKKARAKGRKVETSSTECSSQSGEDSGLMEQWAAEQGGAATRRSSGSATPGHAAAAAHTASDTASDRTALLGATKPTGGKGASAAEAEALRAAQRAASVGAAAASTVSQQGEQITGVVGSAKTAAEIAARAERVDQCYSTFGALKMAWSRGASLVTGEYAPEPQPQPQPEPEPEPRLGVVGKPVFFRVVKRVRIEPRFEPRSDGVNEGRWLEEGASVQVVESKWVGERICRMRLLGGGWVSAIDGGEKVLRRDRSRSRAASGSDGEDDVVLAQLAKLTTQNLETATHINGALAKQSKELEEIDASATEAAESTGRLNASAATRLAKLGKAPKTSAVAINTRSV